MGELVQGVELPFDLASSRISCLLHEWEILARQGPELLKGFELHAGAEVREQAALVVLIWGR